MRHTAMRSIATLGTSGAPGQLPTLTTRIRAAAQALWPRNFTRTIPTAKLPPSTESPTRCPTRPRGSKRPCPTSAPHAAVRHPPPGLNRPNRPLLAVSRAPPMASVGPAKTPNRPSSPCRISAAARPPTLTTDTSSSLRTHRRSRPIRTIRTIPSSTTSPRTTPRPARMRPQRRPRTGLHVRIVTPRRHLCPKRQSRPILHPTLTALMAAAERLSRHSTGPWRRPPRPKALWTKGCSAASSTSRPSRPMISARPLPHPKRGKRRASRRD